MERIMLKNNKKDQKIQRREAKTGEYLRGQIDRLLKSEKKVFVKQNFISHER